MKYGGLINIILLENFFSTLQSFSTTAEVCTFMSLLMNHFHAGLFWAKNFFLAFSIFQVFSSRSLNAFVERDKTKFTKSFLPAFFYSLAIAKSSVSLLILFSTKTSDASKLDNLLFFLFCSFCCSLFCLLRAALFSILSFYDRHLYIVLFEGYLFPSNLDDLDETSKPKHQKFAKKNAFYNFWLITVNPFHFLICFCFQTVSQKNSGTSPLSSLKSILLVAKTCAVFDFFSFLALAKLILEVGRI